jgi:hypothetical protein
MLFGWEKHAELPLTRSQSLLTTPTFQNLTHFGKKGRIRELSPHAQIVRTRPHLVGIPESCNEGLSYWDSGHESIAIRWIHSMMM